MKDALQAKCLRHSRRDRITLLSTLLDSSLTSLKTSTKLTASCPGLNMPEQMTPFDETEKIQVAERESSLRRNAPGMPPLCLSRESCAGEERGSEPVATDRYRRIQFTSFWTNRNAYLGRGAVLSSHLVTRAIPTNLFPPVTMDTATSESFFSKAVQPQKNVLRLTLSVAHCSSKDFPCKLAPAGSP